MDLIKSNDENQSLPSTANAEAIVEEGRQRAKQLMDIVSKNKWMKNIQGKDYLQLEAWETLGKFYGLTARVLSTEYVEMGNIKGFDAVVEIVNNEGSVLGRAEAGCYTDEKKWGNSDLFSLKSMAQTRATGKAFRLMLSWVVVLAGYQPTPAEEMDGVSASRNFDNNSQESRNVKERLDPNSRLTIAQHDKINKTLRDVNRRGHNISEKDIANKFKKQAIDQLTVAEAKQAITRLIELSTQDPKFNDQDLPPNSPAQPSSDVKGDKVQPLSFPDAYSQIKVLVTDLDMDIKEFGEWCKEKYGTSFLKNLGPEQWQEMINFLEDLKEEREMNPNKKPLSKMTQDEQNAAVGSIFSPDEIIENWDREDEEKKRNQANVQPTNAPLPF